MQKTQFHDQTELINKVAFLLERIKNGDEQAFPELYEAMASYIMLMIRNSVVEEMDQDDLLQEIFCTIYVRIPTLQHCQAGFAWMKRIANNKIVDYSRRKYREEKHFVVTYGNNEEGEVEEPVNDLFEMPEDVVDNKETQRIVREILVGLPEKQRSILFAFYFNNMKIDEIAELMEMNPNTVKTNLKRAKDSFKNQVESLQRENGFVLRAIPVGLLLFILFAQDETIYAAVARNRSKITENVKYRSIQNNQIELTKGAAGKAASGTFAKWGMGIALIAAGVTSGVAMLHLAKNAELFEDNILIEETEEFNKLEEKAAVSETAETESPEPVLPQDIFEYYVAQQADIRGSKISVDIVRKLSHPDYAGTPLSEGMVGYRIDDFDQDGDVELLIIQSQSGDRLQTYPDAELIPEEADMTAEMYEYIDGDVVLSDSVECGAVDTRANDLMANWLVTGNKKYLLQETYIGMSAISDGYYREFTLLRYDGSEFQRIQEGKFDGSSIDNDAYIDAVIKTCKGFHIIPKEMPDDLWDDEWDVMWELANKPYFSSYLENKEFVAQIITENVISMDDCVELYEQFLDEKIDTFHVAEGVVKSSDWEDFKTYMYEMHGY